MMMTYQPALTRTDRTEMGIERAYPPSLTVVVVSFSGPALLARCLASLVAVGASERDDVQAVVVGAFQGAEAATYDRLRSVSTWAEWRDVPDWHNVPRRRGEGIALARGRVIALVEDDCTVARGWLDAVLAAHDYAPRSAAIGGVVEPENRRRAWDGGVFLAEYGARFLRPLPEGRATILPGTNVSYKRAALLSIVGGDGLDEFARDGFFETWVNPALEANGDGAKALRSDPVPLVHNVNSWPVVATLRSRYHHGRGYGGRRAETWRPARRALYGTLCGMLPFLQIVRVARDLKQRKWPGGVGWFLRTLPGLWVCAAAWSFGEMVGYLAGPGDSPDRWR